MTPMDRLQTALLQLGVPVFQNAAQFYNGQLPNDYIVIVSVDARPNTYAGDTDTDFTEQLRASWYSRSGNADHGAAMRKAGRSADFTVVSSNTGYDPSTKHYIVHQEFWTESEE